MNEVQKYVAVSNHGYLGYAVIVNKKFWDDLPADIRGELESAMKDATKFTNDIAESENKDALAKVRATGKTQVYDLTAAETAAWKKVLLPVQEEMKSRIGKDTVEAVQRETGVLK
jgi:C4-dicarboxylate-binding protein DctP